MGAAQQAGNREPTIGNSKPNSLLFASPVHKIFDAEVKARGGAKADGVPSGVQQAAAGLAEAQVGGAMLQGCAVLANRLFKRMAAGGRHLPPSSPPPQLAPLSPQRVACPPPSRSPRHRGRLPTLSGTRSCMRSGATPYDRPCNLRLLSPQP